MEDVLRKVPLSSDIVTQIELNEVIFPIENGLSNIVNPKLSVIANLVSVETQKLDALSATVESIAGTDLSSLSTFVKKDDISSVAYLSSLVAYATNDYLSNNYALLSDVPSTSNFTYLSTTNALISTITNELSNNINPKISSIADQVSAEVLRLDELSGKISGGGGSSIDDYISAITINGTTKTPVDKVVDIGNISSYIPEYTPLSAHNNLVSSYTALESRVLSTENLIGNILSILQEINDTEGE